MGKLDNFKKINYKLPDKILAWRIYGKGMENFGDNKKPTTLQMPEPGEDELLVRSDAVGLCFSDTKIIKFGSDHPRIQGRDLKKEPVIPGHEVALTVIKVGKKWQGKYKPGERYIVQADVYYKGKGIAYGYVLPGGLSQYGIIKNEMLEGDGGSYLIPLKNYECSYSEVALVEPWACVVASYRIKHRDGIKDRGEMLIIGSGSQNKEDWIFDNLFKDRIPEKLVMNNLKAETVEKVKESLKNHDLSIYMEDSTSLSDLASKYTKTGAFDDIIILGDVDNGLLTEAGNLLKPYGILNYMVTSDKPQIVELDAGKIHYDRISFIGDTGNDVSSPYTKNLDYHVKGDSLLLIGAGGPMGQMHVQLAIESENPPKTIIATDISDDRINTLIKKFSKRAKERDINFHVLNPKSFSSPDAYRQHILDINGNRLFDYVVCLAAIPAIIEDASTYLGEMGVLNIFAGVSKGTIVKINIKETATKSVRYIGSSGSAIEDMEYTLRKVEKGELNTNNAVAGVSGMNDVWKGIDAVRTGSFPGKIVVYPHITDLPLMHLNELAEKYPDIGKHLTENGDWTREAEDALLNKFLDIEE